MEKARTPQARAGAHFPLLGHTRRPNPLTLLLLHSQVILMRGQWGTDQENPLLTPTFLHHHQVASCSANKKVAGVALVTLHPSLSLWSKKRRPWEEGY